MSPTPARPVDPTAGRRVVKRGLVVVVIVGLVLTIALAVAIGWPYALAALLPFGCWRSWPGTS